MKQIYLLLRIVIVGLLWSVFFIEGVRVIMLTNWYFDILRWSHWIHAWNLWISGWVIDEPKEWAFILIVLSMIPVWITSWVALSAIKWELILKNISVIPLSLFGYIFEKPLKQIKNKASKKVVHKKKSYKEIRPKTAGAPIEAQTPVFSEERRATLSGAPLPKKVTNYAPTPIPSKAPEPKEFSHSLFNLEADEDTIDFDLFEDTVVEEPEVKKESIVKAKEPQQAKKIDKKPENKQQQNYPKKIENKTQQTKPKNPSVNSTFELLKQKGFDVITGATIKNTFIDFIGVSKTQICLCLNDKEPGDWLADEERFNDEEPLWFSESSHRISPVRKADLSRITLEEKLKEADLTIEVTPYVIIQIGNIINAEDMLDIWKDMNVNVTRIDRGTPKEIPLFAKTIDDANDKVDKSVLEKIKKLLKTIA